MTEHELITGLIAQEKTAIEHLVNNYQKSVIKTAFYFVASMEDAEDLSQEIMIEVLRNIGQFRENASFKTWLYRITVNRSLDHLRKQKRRSIFQAMGSYFTGRNGDREMLRGEPASPDTTGDDREKRKILDSAVNSLPENQRIAFVLSKYEELPYKEIAGIMNLSVSSVESLIHRAKMNLQKKLVSYFSEYAKECR